MSTGSTESRRNRRPLRPQLFTPIGIEIAAARTSRRQLARLAHARFRDVCLWARGEKSLPVEKEERLLRILRELKEQAE